MLLVAMLRVILVLTAFLGERAVSLSTLQNALQDAFTSTVNRHHAKWAVPPPSGACSANSHVFLENPNARSWDGALHRVVVAGFMSSGSTWLRKLLEEASGQTTCAVYPNEGCHMAELDAFCKSCDQSGAQSERKTALYVKTHWPSTGWQPDTHNYNLTAETLGESSIMTHSMQFSKLVVLVRHPLEVISSVSMRWGGYISAEAARNLADAIYCWSSWWARVIETLPKDQALVVRYEDLCEDPDSEIDRLINFFGYKRQFQGHSKGLDCHHSTHATTLELAARNFEQSKLGLAAEVTNFLEPILKMWGYASQVDNLGEIKGWGRAI